MDSKIIIVCESIYNSNTRRLGLAMARELGCRCVDTNEATQLKLDRFDVIGLGSGIYFGSHHPLLVDFVKNLGDTPKSAFLFSTRGAPFLGGYHSPMKQLLSDKGIKLLGEFSAKGYDNTGPFTIIGGGNPGKPDERDQQRAAQFVRKILPAHVATDHYQRVKTPLPVRNGQVNTYQIQVNGTPIVLKGDMVTVNQNACSGCGKCVRICPLEVMQLSEGKAIPLNQKECILCDVCVQSCSKRAIFRHANWTDAIRVAFHHGKKKSLYNRSLR